MSDSFLPAILISLIVSIIIGGMIYLWNRWLAPTSEKGRHGLFYTVRFVLHAYLAFSLVTVCFEVPFFRNIIRREVLEVFSAEKFLRDVDFVHKYFSKEDIRDFRTVMTKALAGRVFRHGEDDLLDSVIYPRLEGPIRSDLTITREQSLVRIPTGGSCFFVEETQSVNVHAHSTMSPIPLPLYTEVDTISGIPDSLLYQLVYFKIDGKSLNPPPSFNIRSSGKIVIFDGRTHRNVKDDENWEWKTRKHIPLTDKWISWLSLPTKGVKIKFGYSGLKIDPQLYLFVMGPEDPTEVEPEVPSLRGTREWDYDGWLFRNQGWVLSWNIPPKR